MTKDEKKHKEAVASMGCALCHFLHGDHEPAPVELHHLRGGGWGKGDYKTLIPLDYNHHRGPEGIHTLGTKAWERKFGVTQAYLLDWTLRELKGKA